MDKVLAPIDELIAGIGKFIMVKPRFVGLFLLLLVILSIFIGIWGIKSHSSDDITLTTSTSSAASAIQNSAPTSHSAAISGPSVKQTISENTINTQSITVQNGDNLAVIFQRMHLSAQELQAIMASSPQTHLLTKLKPGQIINFSILDNQVQQLIYPISKTDALTVLRTNDGFKVHLGAYSLPTASASSVSEAKVSVPVAATTDNNISATAANWTNITVEPGDTLSDIFSQLHLSAKDLQIVAQSDKPQPIFRKLRPGDSLRFYIINQQLMQIIYSNDKQSYSFTRADNKFTRQEGVASSIPNVAANTTDVTISTLAQPTNNEQASTPPLTNSTQSATAPINTSLRFVSSEIHGSLYRTLDKAGLPPKYIQQVINIFGQYSNLQKELRKGDRVAILYQPSSHQDDKTIAGGIVAAELTTQKGKTYQLVQFTDPTGHTAYYTPAGLNLHPPIERAPVHYKYISSYFSIRRWQPILHFFRPHEGVDYAAVEGTPIKAAGDGKIIYLGRKGGYGNTIIVKHDARYSTLYAHLSRYATHMHDGSYVKQNQIIGYVGHTGLATGPHLHFEIHVNNKPYNPLTVALPTGTPIARAYRSEFFAHTKSLLAQLNLHEKIYLAAQSSNSKNS